MTAAFYGTTQYAGPAGNGSVFRVTTNGLLTVLYSFVGGSFGDGSGVTAPVLQGPGGQSLRGGHRQRWGLFSGGIGSDFELINPDPTPIIIAQPTNLTVSAGSDASFTVSASSASPLTYQWTFDGTNIDAATNTALTLTNVSLAQAGSYSVDVANSNGTVASVTALLSVTQAQAIVTLSNLFQTYDGTAKIAAATTQPPGLTVDLLYDNSPDAPTNAGSYTVVGAVDDPSYFGSATNTLVVSNAALLATANNCRPLFQPPQSHISRFSHRRRRRRQSLALLHHNRDFWQPAGRLRHRAGDTGPRQQAGQLQCDNCQWHAYRDTGRGNDHAVHQQCFLYPGPGPGRARPRRPVLLPQQPVFYRRTIDH